MGLYLHIPFCKQACHYCDFHFSTNQRYRRPLIEAMVVEMERRRDFLPSGEALSSVYLGGGTPSILPPEELEILFAAIFRYFSIAPDAEITLEANPDDLDEAKLRFFAQETPVNRLSLGVQSFDDEVLRWMNRSHDGQTARKALDQLQKFDFQINADLIYALPKPFDYQWESDLKTLLAYQPEHISAYTLTIEAKTAFGHYAQKGRLQALPDAQAATQFVALHQQLEAAGYEGYEISNFARQQHYARHNTAYWMGKAYLGIGPGAHSYRSHERIANLPNNARYLSSTQAGATAYTHEILSRQDRINEYLLTRLRTRWGCDLEVLQSQYHFDFWQYAQKEAEQFIQNGWLVLREQTLYLTAEGRLFADQIAAAFFVGEDDLQEK